MRPPHRHNATPPAGGAGGLADWRSEIKDVAAIDIDPEPVDWLLEEPKIPRRGITIVVGFRGSTKTTFATWLSARVTKEGEKVFFIPAPEESDIPSFVRPRLEAAGADLAKVRFPKEDEPPMRFPLDADRLEHYVKTTGTKLVVLDPLTAFVPGFTSPTSVRDALQPLARISRQYDCAFVLIHHFRKSGGKTAWDAMGGSGALGDVARAIYVYGDKPEPSGLELLFGFGAMFKPTEDEEGVEQQNVRLLAPLKLSADAKPPGLLFEFETVDIGLPAPVPRVQLLGETEVDGETLFAGWMAIKRRDEEADHGIEQAVTFLLNTLADGPMETADVNTAAKDAGISQRTLERARNRLKVVAYQEDRKWWVKLPEMPDAPPADWTTT